MQSGAWPLANQRLAISLYVYLILHPLSLIKTELCCLIAHGSTSQLSVIQADILGMQLKQATPKRYQDQNLNNLHKT